MQNKRILAEKVEMLDKAVTVACEMTGTVWSDAAKAEVVKDLMPYAVQDVLNALNRCRRELKGRLTLADILQRIDTGLVSADEAFGILAGAWADERSTAVVPEIALLAMGQGAAELLAMGDKTGARMAFREAYERMADRLPAGAKVQWTVSAGTDKQQMAAAVCEAVGQGRLSHAEALPYLPAEAGRERAALLAEQTPKLPPLSREDGAKEAAALLAKLGVKRLGAAAS